jgi:hypothetical protein
VSLPALVNPTGGIIFSWILINFLTFGLASFLTAVAIAVSPYDKPITDVLNILYTKILYL